jgi:hypothetical protein
MNGDPIARELIHADPFSESVLAARQRAGLGNTQTLYMISNPAPIEASIIWRARRRRDDDQLAMF